MIIDRIRAFNLREVRRHSGRTAMLLAVVAISATLLVAVFGIAGSITGSSSRLVAGIGGNASLEVSGVTDTGFPEALFRDMAKVPGVDAAVPMLRMSVGKPSNRVLLLGVNTRVRAMLSPLQRAVQDKIGRLVKQPDRVAVGAGTGRKEGESFALGNGKVTVAAVIAGVDADRVNGGNFIVGPLPLMQARTDRVGMIDSVLVITAPETDLGQVRQGLADVVDGRAVVAEPAFRSAQSAGPVAIMRTLMLSAASTALVVAGFLIFNAMSMAITQRRPAISMLRAIGADKLQMVLDLLLEAGLIGLVGGIAGIGTGRGYRQAGDRRPPCGAAAGIRVANPIHSSGLRNSCWRAGLRCGQRWGGGAGGPAGAQCGARRGLGPRRGIRRRRRRASVAADGGRHRRRFCRSGCFGRIP